MTTSWTGRVRGAWSQRGSHGSPRCPQPCQVRVRSRPRDARLVLLEFRDGPDDLCEGDLRGREHEVREEFVPGDARRQPHVVWLSATSTEADRSEPTSRRGSPSPRTRSRRPTTHSNRRTLKSAAVKESRSDGLAGSGNRRRGQLRQRLPVARHRLRRRHSGAPASLPAVDHYHDRRTALPRLAVPVGCRRQTAMQAHIGWPSPYGGVVVALVAGIGHAGTGRRNLQPGRPY
jgi:hypothetical protein